MVGECPMDGLVCGGSRCVSGLDLLEVFGHELSNGGKSVGCLSLGTFGAVFRDGAEVAREKKK
jgi:hypothetical protein